MKRVWRFSATTVAAGESQRIGCASTPSAVSRLRLPPAPRRAQRGVALVITVIMLAVISFMAIAFLVLSYREKGSVTTASEQTLAQLAAETAVERAKADLIAPILAYNNPFNFDLRVSTNYVNRFGYDDTQPTELLAPDTRYWATNINYEYKADRSAFTPDERDQNIANLFYSPRPPVFVTNRAAANAYDFRYYLDLNRNGRHDTNGFLPVMNPTNGFYNTNGIPIPAIVPGNTLSNFFVGDPEWIGILERPDQPHSSSNRFTQRFAWLAVPAGKTLDLNAIHNQAKMRSRGPEVNQDGFLRNMGVGTWELNLASFLVDLNTNLWPFNNDALPPHLPALPYLYRTNVTLESTGAAFDDALGLTRYRYGFNWSKLNSVSRLFGLAGANAFGLDRIDSYSDGPLMTTTALPTSDNDPLRVAYAWPGSDTFNHHFTPQDFFNVEKTWPQPPTRPANPIGFTARLRNAGTNDSSYDRYTFYRLLSQLGTDTSAEDDSRLNLNYVNVGGLRTTNFVAWDDPALVTGSTARGIPVFGVSGALLFFTNAADRLLRASTAEWFNRDTNAYFQTFGSRSAFSVTNIPVLVNVSALVSNRLGYTPAVHRLLQLAANTYDANNTNYLPSVFRPRFTRNNNGLFISGYEQVLGDPTPQLTAPMDMTAVPVGTDMRINVYGVPWVVGAKKGFPNFNELAMQSVFTITRKIEVSRRDLRRTDAANYATNQMYNLSLSNAVAVELWNSYRNDYTNYPVMVRLFGDVTMALTNQYGVMQLANLSVPLSNAFTLMNTASNMARWTGTGLKPETPNEQSFYVPLRTNIVFVPDSIWLNRTRELTTNIAGFARRPGFPVPQMGFVSKTRLRCVVQLGGANGPIVDYVQLDGLNDARDLTAEFSESDGTPGLNSLWDTNRLGGGASDTAVTRGINYQFLISLGEYPLGTADWGEYGLIPPGSNIGWEIDNFRDFFHLSPIRRNTVENTNYVQQVPFSPSRKISRIYTFQANDPLVHYLTGDLVDLTSAGETRKESIKQTVRLETLENIGILNKRYRPWGGNPKAGQSSGTSSSSGEAYNLAVKDPGVRSSDDWEFPTNKFPNVGWLGRVHRGTPWQTVHLKSTNIVATTAGIGMWRDWAGSFISRDANNPYFDTVNRAPWSDRLIFDSFTTALSDTASRGQLSINQTNLAAWSAVFGGVLAVTNNLSDSQVRVLRLTSPPGSPTNAPFVVPPAGIFEPTKATTWSPLYRLVNGADGINATRASTKLFPRGVFEHLGDILATPALTDASPFLNQKSATQLQYGLTDAAYERLPQQVLGLLTLGQPRFVIYGYGQSLSPATASVVPSGPFAGMCTNYQITAETAVRAVVRVDGAPGQPRVVVESFNPLPPD